MSVIPERVTVTEVCPRDGFQSLPANIPLEEKVEIVNEIIYCGFKQIEVTSFVHPKAIPQLKDADELLQKIDRRNGVQLRALVPNLIGLERAIKAKVDKVKLMLSATDSHSLSNANRTTFDAMEDFKPLINRANEAGMPVSGSISVVFGCPYEGDVPVSRILQISEKYADLGVTNISLADTTGMGNPVRVRKIIRAIKKEFPEFDFSLHLHNTRGMAFANALVGLEEGIVNFDSSVAGLGGCPYAPNASGNISSEDLIHALHEMGIETGIDLDRVIKLGKNLEKKFPQSSDSFILKAGKCSDLHLAPKEQVKLG
ncbi:hydroxymethylglutaryl-CoA lyase [Bhargavaea cecembensis]|uniref:hydroxymethylglutaryl-CoA lyase n=1 Tax=Bhargavaea cecembensis TaxID=394098 RepID=A0A165H5A6_9BACL|nr:hydroxymethylglutaryl-CoA lyase [Bhargavaea cecembensis]KZE38815.1 hydroxymethylglutaryl-CoA lyase [Bhargavaea cecembensis]